MFSVQKIDHSLFLKRSLWLTLLLVISFSAPAQETAEPIQGDMVASVDFTHRVTGEKSIWQTSDTWSVSYFHSYRREIRSVSLEIWGRHERWSKDLDIRINGKSVEVINQLSQSGESTIIQIDPRAILIGQNEILLRVRQMAADIKEIRLSVTGTWVPMVPTLGMLNDLFNDKAAYGPELYLCLPGYQIEKELNELKTRSVALALQGAALRMGDTLPVVRWTEQPSLLRDTLLLGTVAELAHLLLPAEIERVTGPRLFFRAHPVCGQGFLLVVTGRNDAEVLEAAITLGLVHQQMPSTSGATIQGLQLPAVAAYVRRNPIQPGAKTSFRDLGIPAVELSITNHWHTEFNFFTSATVADGDAAGRMVELELRLSVLGEAPPDTQLVLEINGSPLSQEGLKENFESPTIARLEGGMVRYSFPANLLKPGRNQGTMRLKSSKGIVGDWNPPLVQVNQESSFATEPASQMPPVANLKNFAATTYPFVTNPDGEGITVAIMGKRHDLLLATWNLLAKLSQVSNTLLLEARFTLGLPTQSQKVIVVCDRGDLRDLPPSLFGEDLTANLHSCWSNGSRPTQLGSNSIPNLIPPPTETNDDGLLIALLEPIGTIQSHWFIVSGPDRPGLASKVSDWAASALWQRMSGQVVWLNRSTSSLDVMLSSLPSQLRSASTPAPITSSQPLATQSPIQSWRHGVSYIWIGIVLGILFVFAWLAHRLTDSSSRNH